jgi:hypothetical protein
VNREQFLCEDPTHDTHFLYYTNGHKYQARNAMVYWTGICPGCDIITDLIILKRNGWMFVDKYFAWDGPSGPAIDTRTNMKASHAHDALAALMRKGLLPMSMICASNDVLRRIMIRDGALPVRANMYKAVLDRTSYWANPKNQKPFCVAP